MMSRKMGKSSQHHILYYSRSRIIKSRKFYLTKTWALKSTIKSSVLTVLRRGSRWGTSFKVSWAAWGQTNSRNDLTWPDWSISKSTNVCSNRPLLPILRLSKFPKSAKFSNIGLSTGPRTPPPPKKKPRGRRSFIKTSKDQNLGQEMHARCVVARKSFTLTVKSLPNSNLLVMYYPVHVVHMSCEKVIYYEV